MSNLKTLGTVEKTFESTFAFILKNGLSSYDPNDSKAAPIYLWSWRHNTLFHKVIRKTLNLLELIAPITMRKLLGVKKTVLPQSHATLAEIYHRLFLISKDESKLAEAKGHLTWLADNKAKSEIGSAWGFPFSWASYEMIPPQTGLSHTTLWCATAFFTHYRLTQDPNSLKETLSSASFLTNGLKKTIDTESEVAFSYTPLDNSQVINNNAEIASLLLRLSKYTDDQEYLNTGIKVLNFVVNNQHEDGSWMYARVKSVIDHYHTGMVLLALLEILESGTLNEVEHKQAKDSLNKGLRFYVKHMFTSEPMPKMTPASRFPINSYSCAQSIYTIVQAVKHPDVDADLQKEIDHLLHPLVENIISKLIEKDGSIISFHYKYKTIRLKSIRWAQAMFTLALAEYIRVFKGE